MKRKVLLVLVTALMMSFGCNKAQIAHASTIKDPKEIYDYTQYNKEYKTGKQIGEYYKNGFMGYHKVVEIEKVSVEFNLSDLYDNYSSKDDKISVTISKTQTTTIIDQTIVGVNVSVGFIQMISAIANLLDVGSVGASNTLSSEFTLFNQTMYSKSTLFSRTVTSEWNLDNIHPEKNIFSIGRVTAYIKIDIKTSYIEEQGVFGNWYKISNEAKGAYVAKHFLFDLDIFVYPDGTFGNKTLGLFRYIVSN